MMRTFGRSTACVQNDLKRSKENFSIGFRPIGQDQNLQNGSNES